MANLLASEKSPYLLQHADNPVDWRPWGAAAFEEARRTDRPVFLSIGYSTCHWCHVMAHESFENPAIADILNRDFVSIKVDREERPDVDRLYMSFVQATTGSGGWPMSVWLTPDSAPFVGGTYFPPEDRYGRMGFPALLERIARAWKEDRGRLIDQGRRVLEALGESATASGARPVEPAGLGEIHSGFQYFVQAYDEDEGGFGGAPKFPRPSTFNFLLRVRLDEARDAHAREMVFHTLRKMVFGGVRDHVGGGFHRYSVDAGWHVPHFEKMLYDQAQLVCSLTEAWQISGETLFADVVAETIQYVERQLRHARGGFLSAEDADSLDAAGHQREGAFYVWTKEEIDALLPAGDAALFCAHYDVRPGGNVAAEFDPHGEFTGSNILIQRQSLEEIATRANPQPDEVRASLERSRHILFEARAQRSRPHLDDKVITAWNGLMISACARAGAAFGNHHWIGLASESAAFIRSEMTTPDGQLLRTWREGASPVHGFAEDYAFLIRGLLDLYEATFEIAWLRWAVELQQQLDERFYDEAGGGYFGSEAGDPLVPIRLKEDYDGAEPSANSISAQNLLRLSRMLHRDDYDARAREIFRAFSGQLERVGHGVPELLAALAFFLQPPSQAVIAGADPSPFANDLRREFSPFRVLLHADGADGQAFLAEHSEAISEMRPVNGRTALYVCENFTCSAPRVAGEVSEEWH